ncbi:unnamed protein product [Moneuplotes crassus]|uniref:Cilium assembly protein DZIP1 N-terminal domain-containing protein n=1 Tax=Euplotes crassus TaxID=5936 RepID=A0AAD1Y0F9_EUPCR|nr:unnamed protein product [Moneuplotes crassus]
MEEQPDSSKEFQFVFEDDSADLLFLKQFEILSVLKGDLQPILQFLDNATFSDVKENFPYQDEESLKLIKIMQMGIQYSLFTQKVLKKKAELCSQYALYEDLNYEKLKEFSKKQRRKIAELKKRLASYDETLDHFQKIRDKQDEHEIGEEI